MGMCLLDCQLEFTDTDFKELAKEYKKLQNKYEKQRTLVGILFGSMLIMSISLFGFVLLYIQS